jgi:hypothetical protein
LLYLTSQIFGTAYLDFFDVSGFHTLGLGTLGMLEYRWLVSLAWFVSMIRSTLRTTQRWRFAAGLAAILLAGTTKPLVVLGYRNSISPWDIDIAAYAIGICIVLTMARKRLGPHVQKIEAALAKANTLLPRVEKLVKNNLLKEDSLEIRLIRGARRYFVRRVWEMRVGGWILSGYISMFIAIPAMAWILAMTSVQQERYRSFDQNAPARVPVYWVGDRVVFLTFDTGCFVHTQIAGVLQSKRSCGRYIRDVVDVQD